jgi:uncharacterized repeat protein (TIGR01451 family)/LPXTG-motif cell wall-anchored protein
VLLGVLALLVTTFFTIALSGPATAAESVSCSGDLVFEFPTAGRRLIVPQSLSTGPHALGFTVDPGRYVVEVWSWDGHSTREPQDQPNEQWQARLLNGDGSTVAVTPPTEDLPDDQDFVSTGFRIELGESVSGVTAVHAQLGDPEIANSIEPVCIGFRALPPRVDISLEKLTNGADGPEIKTGDPITWTYEVTNTGEEDLIDVTVVDEVHTPSDVAPPAITCPTTELAVGESMTCTATGTALDLGIDGTYQNEATTTGTGAVTGRETSDDDPSSYTNPPPPPPKPKPAVTIEKRTNGRDADHPSDADVPRLNAGETVTWTYEVTNTGEETLTNITVVDEVLAPSDVAPPTVSCPQTTLAVGESMTCSATGTALDLAAGEYYANKATVTGTGESSGSTVVATDTSSYLPVTGVETGALALAGFGLTMFGGGLLFGTRRRSPRLHPRPDPRAPP